MSERHPVWQFFGALARQWWIIAAAVVVALAVGAWRTKDATDTYTGEAIVRINTTMAAKPGFPIPDVMLGEVRSGAEYRSIAASETGLPEEQLGGKGAYTTGQPQDRLFVTFRSSDRDLAASVPKGLARAAVVRAKELSMDELGRAQAQLELTEQMLAKAKALPVEASPLKTEAEAQFAKDQAIYSYELAVVSQRAAVLLASSAYTYDGNGTVKVDAAADARRNALVGAAFAGLFLGVAVAALREFLARRPWERSA